MNLPINDINLQLLPNSGNDLGPGISEYSFAKSTSSCDIVVRTVEDLARQIVILKLKNRVTNSDIIEHLQPASKHYVIPP